MSKKPSISSSGVLPNGLPEEFFDSDKKSKKAQEDDLAKELEEFEKEMAALQAESEEQLNEEFKRLQEEKNLEELDQQINQWKKIVELEKKAEELRSKPISENPTKKFKTRLTDQEQSEHVSNKMDEEDDDLDDIEEKMFNWRSKGL